MFCVRYSIIGCLVLTFLVGYTLAAQEPPGQGLPTLVRGNERFGTKLLQEVHSTASDRNLVISPISLTIIFAALQNNLLGTRSARKEIGETFGWKEYPQLAIPTKMLLAAFEDIDQTPVKPHDPLVFHPAEGAWISNVLLYRGKDTIPHRFIENAQKYFGMKFTNTGAARPTASDLGRARNIVVPLPKLSSTNDILISSGTHLQTTWAGNTFSMSEPYKANFQTAGGESKQVETLRTELEGYPYAKTDAFEAVSLPCDSGYMLAVLPAPGKDIRDLERQLAEAPDLIDAALKRQLGTIAMPTFRIRFETDMRHEIEAMGIKEVFKDLGPMINVPH